MQPESTVSESSNGNQQTDKYLQLKKEFETYKLRVSLELEKLRDENLCLKDEIVQLKGENVAMLKRCLPKLRKPIAELEKQRKDQILALINSYYNTNDNLKFCLIEGNTTGSKFNASQSSSFKAIFNLTDVQYKAMYSIGAPGKF